ncbi:kinase-like protein [Lentinus brumalis]|uniref:non-specific serine/threonine protein kinase n=1 Tax=Lentinus brumalis TaxID=2498619 RepID=A0A371DDL5_9APHY|nr:kinase-like protein [Polyporus brumalis]
MRLFIEKDRWVTGGFGRVYHGRVLDDRDPPKLVAVKKCHVTDHVEHPRLQHEACALVLLQGHRAIPDVYAWGKSQFYEYLALELLDTDFSDIKGKLTLRNLVAIAVQVLDGLEHVHSRGIVHCDVKPSNLMLGLEEDGRVRLIDFGICRPYRDPVTLEHLPDKGTPYSVGTSEYMSLNCHLHHSPSRRDDIESLSYTLLALMAGRLPWDTCDGDPRVSSQRERVVVFSRKKQWTGARLTGLGHGGVAVFGEFVDYARELGYAEEPDYGGCRDRFRRLITVPSISEELLSAVRLPESRSFAYAKGSNGRWMPTFTWGPAAPVDADELLGDEDAIVRTRLDGVDGVPEGQEGHLCRGCPPEVMRSAPMAAQKFDRTAAEMALESMFMGCGTRTTEDSLKVSA